MKAWIQKGHAIFMNNFYKSFALLKILLEENTCTGTLNKKRICNPVDLIKKNWKRWKCILYKREILCITNEFANEIKVMTNRRGQEKIKPKTIIEYHKHISEIIRQDQMIAYNPMECKTLWWYKKIFIQVLQLIIVNFDKLYNHYSGQQKLPLYNFWLYN